MKLDKLLLDYLNANYSVKNNLLHDTNYDITVLPYEAEKDLMKVFYTSKDATHITLFMWLSSEGMKDITENWFKCKMFNIGPIPEDMTYEFVNGWRNATENLNYNYELVDG